MNLGPLVIMDTLTPFRLLALLTLFTLQALLVHAQICPPFTPNLPVSAPLAGSQAIADAIQNISAVINAVLSFGIISDNDTSFSVDVYSLHDEGSLFTHHFSALNLQNATEGVTSVDSNTIYRIGSISKVFTVYTYLANVGDISWNQPITKYVPELAEAASSTGDDSDIDVFRWDDITLGSLASHLSGVSRDVQSNLDFSQAASLGFPPVPALNGSYCGGIAGFEFPCDRACELLN
jgi:CubicO group peptidase (beta-lactamase class C family)